MSKLPVPMLDLGYQHRAIAEEVAEGFAAVLDTTSFVLGPAVGAFERAYAEYLDVEHVIGVGNGTDALELALRAVGVGAGDEVVIPANTFVATAEAVARVGARIRLIDSGEDFLMEPGALADVLETRTRAVIPVHLYGQIADVAGIRAEAGDGVLIVEDAAQSQGARVNGTAAGALGDVAATSFYPGKNLGAYGDAGAVSTGSERIAKAVRELGNHGGTRKYEHRVVGTNSRLDALQAVVLSAKLKRLDGWNKRRRELADRYRALLEEVPAIERPPLAEPSAHVYHQFVVQVSDRDRVLESMVRAGIGVGIHYPIPIHLLPAFANMGLGGPGSFPRAELQAQRILSLPIYPGLTDEMQDRVVDELVRAAA